MSVKEMPIEEKYDKLFDMYILQLAKNYAFNKEMGTMDKWVDYSLKVDRKMMPSFIGPALFKLMKTLAPGKTFKQAINKMMYEAQTLSPLSNLELSWISGREVVIRIKNCEELRRSREMVKKAGLKTDPRFYCEWEKSSFMSPEHPSKMFGMDISMDLEENGCKMTVKLK